MKVIILAGGLPSTIIEEDEKMPKPMAEIGGRPLLWHIMKQYAYYGYNDFLICTGFKGNVIKDYFMNYYIYQSDITVNLQTNEVVVHRKQTEDWNVSIIDTGRDSSIMDRLCMMREYIGQETALVTYGDCLSDINIEKLVALHKASNDNGTFAVAHPTGRNEILPIGVDGTYAGTAKVARKDAWVDACSMVLEPAAFEYLEENRKPPFSSTIIECVAQEEAVQTYFHEGFWSPVETVRDKTWLESLWAAGKAPWKVWED